MTTKFTAVNDGNFFRSWNKATYELAFTDNGALNGTPIAISASNPFNLANTQFVGETNGSTNGLAYSSIATGPAVNNVTPYLFTQEGVTLSASNKFNPAVSADFGGTGLITFDLTTKNIDSLGTAALHTGGQPIPATVGFSTNVTANASVSYTFTPLPVPVAVWLLGSGVMGLGAASRRRRAA